MADTKTTALTELTTFDGDEQFYVVDDDDGTPTSKRVTIENLTAEVTDGISDAIAAGDASTLTSAQTYADGKVSDTAYGSGWNGDTTDAPSKNAVYDKVQSVLDRATAYKDLVLASSPTVYYPLDETSGTTADNLATSGATYDGTINGGAGLNYPGAGAGVPRGIDFDGTDDSVTATLPTLASSWSVEMWFMPDAVSTNKIFSMTNTSQSTGFVVYFSGNDIALHFPGAGDHIFSNAAVVAAPSSILTWYHLVLTVDASNTRCYLQGRPLGTVAKLTLTAPTGSLTIGRSTYTTTPGWFNGQMAHVALYPSVLTADEARSHYIAGVSGF